MKAIHRIYSWVMFIPIATLLVAYAIVKLAYNLLIGFTYNTFYYQIPPPDSVYFHPTLEYWYRIGTAILAPFLIFWEDLKELKYYKF